MKLTHGLGYMALLLMFLLITACSKNSSTDVTTAGLPENTYSNELKSHQVAGIWKARIDPENQTFSIEPANRQVQDGLHLWLSQYFAHLITIESYSFVPEFWADIRLDHPLPGSGIIAYDPRIIAELPANAGVSMNYPHHEVIGNNSVVRFPDGYTRLKDTGTYPGNVNPFLAYFKDQPYRQWASTGVTSNTRRWMMDLDGFGGPFEYLFIVEVSTNFPNPPEPIEDNCPECINIRCIQDRPLVTSAELTVYLHDWQGEHTIGDTKVECPGVFEGTKGFSWEGLGPGPYDSTVVGTVTNDLNAPPGTYKMLISSHNFDWNLYMYQEFDLLVADQPPAIIHRVSLGGSAKSVFISGDYAYVCDGNLQIINISNPNSMYLAKTVVTPGLATKVHVQGDYAYVTENPFEYDNALHIVDINPSFLAHIVNTLDIMANDVFTSGDYAYVGDWATRFDVIDINPPESMHTVGQVPDIIEIENVYKTGNYAYITDTIPQFHIISVSSPTSPYISKTIGITGIGKCIQVADNYAYVADSAGLEIIDVYPSSSAYIVKTVNFATYPSRASGVALNGGYAYVTDGLRGMHVVDIDPISSAYVVEILDTPGWAYDIALSGNFAFIADGTTGLISVRL